MVLDVMEKIKTDIKKAKRHGDIERVKSLQQEREEYKKQTGRSHGGVRQPRNIAPPSYNDVQQFQKGDANTGKRKEMEKFPLFNSSTWSNNKQPKTSPTANVQGGSNAI